MNRKRTEDENENEDEMEEFDKGRDKGFDKGSSEFGAPGKGFSFWERSSTLPA